MLWQQEPAVNVNDSLVQHGEEEMELTQDQVIAAIGTNQTASSGKWV